MEGTLDARYRELVSKWIRIYLELFEGDKDMEEAALNVCGNIPFGYGKPQSVSAVCVQIASNRMKKPISPKEIIHTTGISMRTFINIKNYLKNRGVS